MRCDEQLGREGRNGLPMAGRGVVVVRVGGGVAGRGWVRLLRRHGHEDRVGEGWGRGRGTRRQGGRWCGWHGEQGGLRGVSWGRARWRDGRRVGVEREGRSGAV